MYDRMRMQACAILGISPDAGENEIKTAYKTLVKQYHPDTGDTANPEYYNAVVQAYRYLREHLTDQGDSCAIPPKILGQPAKPSKERYSYSKGKEYAQFEKNYQQKRQEKQEAFAQRCREERERQETYERAMNAINAIRVAEALKRLISETER